MSAPAIVVRDENGWTDAGREEVRRLYIDEGLSAREIIKRLDLKLERGAIQGLIHRMGLVKGTGHGRHRARRLTADQSDKKRDPNSLPPRAAMPTGRKAGATARPFMALGARDCRFPVGPTPPAWNSEAQLFCGKPAEPKKPYCAECGRRAYLNPTPAKGRRNAP